MSTLALDLSPRRRRAFRMLVASEIRLARRRPVGLIVSVGVPVVLLVIFGSIPATTRPQASLGGISFFNLYVPALLLFVFIALGLMGLAQQLAGYRQQGVLRRMSTTPVSPSWLLGAQVAVCLIFAAIAIAILLGVGAAVFGMELPHGAGGYLAGLGTLALSAAAMIGLGLCPAALTRSPQMANAMSILLFYPLMFFSGIYVPLQEIHSSVIHEIAKLSPTGAGFNALHATFTGGSPSAGSVLVLAAWAVISSLVAARLFRWE